MTRVRLLHWNTAEAAERGARLQAPGYDVEWAPPAGPQLMSEARSAPPQIYVIHLSKASGVVADVTQPAVRAAGLSHGLVDYKIASFDDTWSGLLFRRRRERLGRGSTGNG